MTGFCPLFVHFFFCTEGENDILTMFLSHFLHSPLSPQKSIFLSFWRKSLDDSWFLRRICDAHDVFNDCVTHAMMFLIQRVLWALMKSIWRICNARGFKNCATRTVSDFMNPMRSNFYFARRISDARCFLYFRLCRWRALLSILYEFRDGTLTRCGSEPMNVFRSCFAASFYLPSKCVRYFWLRLWHSTSSMKLHFVHFLPMLTLP